MSKAFATTTWGAHRVLAMAAILIAAVLAPTIIQSPYHLSVLTNTAIAVMLTLSMNLVIGTSGQFSLAHAAFFGIGAYVPALIALRVGVSPWIGLGASIVAAGLIGVAIGIPILRLRGYYLAVSTLAFALFVELIARQAIELTGGAYGLQNLPPIEIFGYTLRGKDFLPIAVFGALLTYIAVENLRASALGRAIVAARDSAAAAGAAGINVAHVRLVAFVASAAIAGLAGWTQAFFSLNLTPHVFSAELTFTWLFMMLIGGIGHNVGVILGTIALTVMPELLGFATTQQVLVLGVFMIVVALFAPRGLGGLLDERLFRRRVTT